MSNILQAPMVSILWVDGSSEEGTWKSVAEAFFGTVKMQRARSCAEAEKLVVETSFRVALLHDNLPDGHAYNLWSNLVMGGLACSAIIVSGLPYGGDYHADQVLEILPIPLKEGDLRAAIGRHFPPSLASDFAPRKTQQFLGSLKILSLLDLVQVKCRQGRQSSLRVVSPDGKSEGLLVFDEKGIRHCTCDGIEGPEAFNRLLLWDDGRFEEVRNPPRSSVTIDVPWETLLMEAVRLKDEAAA